MREERFLVRVKYQSTQHAVEQRTQAGLLGRIADPIQGQPNADRTPVAANQRVPPKTDPGQRRTLGARLVIQIAIRELEQSHLGARPSTHHVHTRRAIVQYGSVRSLAEPRIKAWF